MCNNWIDFSEGIDINKLMIHENVRFFIADTCLEILVLNDLIDICYPNNEKNSIRWKNTKKVPSFMLDRIYFDLQNP